uniref:Uncharacterized protein n=1 Tax=Anguilla anguilla TaxID=7936 RepID=A0A0E9W9B4_ANGAN
MDSNKMRANYCSSLFAPNGCYLCFGTTPRITNKKLERIIGLSKLFELK